MFLETASTSKLTPGIDAHVLDVGLGKGGEGVKVDLDFKRGSSWEPVAQQTTQPSGRTDLFTSKLEAGIYRLTFHTGDYFDKRNLESFYPEVVVHFRVKDDQLQENFHVPITLSQFGYSTYRGV